MYRIVNYGFYDWECKENDGKGFRLLYSSEGQDEVVEIYRYVKLSENDELKLKLIDRIQGKKVRIYTANKPYEKVDEIFLISIESDGKLFSYVNGKIVKMSSDANKVLDMKYVGNSYYIIYENIEGSVGIVVNGLEENRRLSVIERAYIDENIWWYIYRYIEGNPGNGDMNVNLNGIKLDIIASYISEPIFDNAYNFVFKVRNAKNEWFICRGDAVQKELEVIGLGMNITNVNIGKLKSKDGKIEDLYYQYKLPDGTSVIGIYDREFQWVEVEGDRVLKELYDNYEDTFWVIVYDVDGKHGIFTNRGSVEPRYSNIRFLRVADNFCFFIHQANRGWELSYLFYLREDEIYSNSHKTGFRRGNIRIIESFYNLGDISEIQVKNLQVDTEKKIVSIEFEKNGKSEERRFIYNPLHGEVEEVKSEQKGGGKP